MESREAFFQRVHEEQQILARLKLASTHVTEAQRERVWAISAAHQLGLSVRQIAKATGLSSSRIHQLLTSPEAQNIPQWLNRLRAPEGTTPSSTALRQCLTEEVETLRWCIEWLEQLNQKDFVVVNLRPEEDEETDYVAYKGPDVRRVMARIAADLEALAQSPENQKESHVGLADGRTKRRRRLAAPEPKPKQRSLQEERAALRERLGLPPFPR